MILYCPDDNGGLEATGLQNVFLCPSCKCIFEVKFSMTKISGSRIQNATGEQSWRSPAILQESTSSSGEVLPSSFSGGIPR